MQNVRSRSDRVAALKKCQPGFLRCGYKAKRQRLVAAHAPVEPWSELRRRNLIADLKRFRGLAIGVTALQRELVGFDEQRLILELVFDPPDCRVHRAVVEPVAHAQREEIFAAVHGLGVQAEMFQRTASQAFELNRKQPEFVQRMVFQRIGSHLRFAQVTFFEAIAVDDQNTVGLQVGNVDFQRRRVHGNQDVDGVAGRINLV